ncbi:MAG: hypothetical protein AAGB22_05420 [Bacteroidota bacterium]
MAVLIGGVACEEKQLEPDIVEPPQLFMTGLLDGQLLNLQVGVDSLRSRTGKQDVFDLIRSWSFELEDESQQSITELKLWVNNHTAPFGEDWEDVSQTFRVGSYAFVSPEIPADNPNQLMRVGLFLSDPQNRRLSSNLLDQPNSSLQIDAVEEVEDQGLRYLKVSLRMNCLLVDDQQTDTVALTNVQAVVLFGGIGR